MAYKNQIFVLSLYFVTDILTPVLGDGDDESGSVSTGVIIVVAIIGSIIVVFTLLLCFHQCCIKPKQTVKPHRIRVIGVGHHPLPPSRVLPSAPPPIAGACPVDPPPYHLYDDGLSSEPLNRNEPRDPFGWPQRPPIVHPATSTQSERHPAPVIPYTRHLGVNQHPSQFTPPPYTG